MFLKDSMLPIVAKAMYLSIANLLAQLIKNIGFCIDLTTIYLTYFRAIVVRNAIALFSRSNL